MEKEYPREVQLTLFDHLKELRKRLFRVAACILILWIVGYWNYDFLARLVMHAIPHGIKKMITNPIAGFYLQMQISIYFAVYCSLPVITHQVYGFIRPALRPREDRTVRIFLGISFFLLTLALIFSHEVLPFLIGNAGSG